MPLSTGTRLGHYEILGSLGAGGMGEVYRARDTRLDRVVALKIIQSPLGSDGEMRERFEREARAISALDHPHICMLYDTGREVVAGDAISFLVMQYLEGETRADRLARTTKSSSHPSLGSAAGTVTATAIAAGSRGPIPFDTALKWAAEIAGALDAAHRRGIVHRDVKPGNVMITKAGTKLLDFGLAKLAAGEPTVAGFGDAGETRMSPGSALTGRGAIVGTLHYMSPEQLEGREVDSRSDIFSFGALLYEMLTGRRAFDGESHAGVIAAILNADAPEIGPVGDARSRLPIVAEPALQRLLARCLAKNPDDRWHSAADLAAELHWIGEERLRAVAEPAAASVPAIAPARAWERASLAAAAVAIVALGVVSYRWYPRPGPPPAPVTFTIEAPEGQPFSNSPGGLSISPDGRLVAFTTGTGQTRQLWVRELGSTVLKRIDRAGEVWHVVWSPDSRFIAYTGTGGNRQLQQLDLTGGPPRTLVETVEFDRGAWNQAGVILFAGQDKRLYRISDAGGQPVAVMEPDRSRQETGPKWPVFLPDGRRYIFLALSDNPAHTALFLASLDAPGRTPLVPVVSNVDYAAGHLFYQRDGTLMAHPFDAGAGRLAGDAFPVIEDVLFNPGNGRGAFAVAASGALAYVSGGSTSAFYNRTLALFDRAGTRLRQVGATGWYLTASFSPDGRQAALTRLASGDNKRSLWLLDIDRGVETRFSIGDVSETNPVWSPDGASIAFWRQAQAGGEDGVHLRSARGGATTAELLFKGAAVPTGFSPDGTPLLTIQAGRIWVTALSGDRRQTELFPGTVETPSGAQFSPDGKWIAYRAGSSGSDAEVYGRPYPPDDRRIRVSTAGGRHPLWTADGRHIVYRAHDDALMSVELSPESGTLRPSTPVQLFTQRRQGAGFGQSTFSMDGRGEQFLLVLPPERASVERAAPITVVLNFAQSVGRK